MQVVVALGDNRALGGEFVAMFVPPLTLLVRTRTTELPPHTASLARTHGCTQIMRELLYPLFFADNINKLRPTTRSYARMRVRAWVHVSAHALAW